MDLSKDRAPNLRIVDVLFLTLAVVSCALRCYTRIFIVRAFGSDDWLMMVAMVFYILYVTSGQISTGHGGGRHQDTLSEYDLSIALKHWWLCYLWYDFAMIFARLSIGIFFLRLTVKRFHIYLMYFIMVSTVGFGLVFMGVAIGECTPPAYFWDKTIEAGTCMNTKIIIALMYLYSTSSLFSDATYAIFPIFLMHGLQMDRRTKYALVPVLGLGWIASIAVIIRFAYLTTLGSTDFTYDAITIAILSSSEQGLAITAGNLATLRPLFTRKFRLWGSLVVQDHSGPSGGRDYHTPTTGALEGGKGRATPDSVPVGLATFIGRHRSSSDEERGVSLDGQSGSTLKQHGIAVTRDIAITSHRRSSLWCSSTKSGNDSQEELHSKLSRETLDENDFKVVPASFLNNDGRLPHSDRI